MKLSAKIITATLLPFVVIITLYYALTTGTAYNYLARVFRQQAVSNLEKAADDIRHSFIDKERQLKFLASTNPPDQKKPEATRVALQLLLHDVEAFFQLSVININGQQWLRLNKFPLEEKEKKPESLFSRPVYQQPILELKTYLGNIQRYKGYPLPFIDMSIPYRNRMTGKISGVIWAQVSFQEIQLILENNIPTKGKLMLVQTENYERLAEADDTDIDYSDLESDALADIMKQKSEKIGTLEKERGDLKVTFFYRLFKLNGLRFILLYYQPNDQIFSLANRLRNNNVYITLGGVVLFSFFSFFLIRIIITPLQALTDKIIALSLQYRPTKDTKQDEKEVIRGDEVMQLGEIFNLFQKQLSAYSEEVEAFNRTLEEKVLMKTEELRLELQLRKQTEEEKENLIKELRKALDEINTLRGILPVCSFCKNIRDDKGHWEKIESYIKDHSQAEFSHSICPECMKKHYPDTYKRMLLEEDS